MQEDEKRVNEVNTKVTHLQHRTTVTKTAIAIVQ
jgi:hypothetical protein